MMYDGDVPAVLDSLKKCDGVLLVSKPCIEIWFMAHYMHIPEKDFAGNVLLRNLRMIPEWNNYKKGVLTNRQQDSLWDNRMKAIEHMKDKTESDKTFSSTVYQCINILGEEKSRSSR